MFVIPAKDFIVYDPDTKRIVPAEGGEVPDNLYWHRRLRDKDVYLVEQINNKKPGKSGS